MQIFTTHSSKPSRRSTVWGRLTSGLTAFLVMMALATLLRVAFFWHYRSSEDAWLDVMPALKVGAEFDAKWLAIALLPAAIFWLASLRWARCFRTAAGLAVLGALGFFVLALINFGFYGFYGTPISIQIFGLMQDDTWAILITIIKDWPIFTYLAALAVIIALPFAAARPFAALEVRRCPSALLWIIVPCLIVLYAVTLRGGIGTFPLRREHLAVSPSSFINDCAFNGAFALYDAAKERKRQFVSTDVMTGVKDLGFSSPAEAEALLPVRHAGPFSGAAKGRHVIISIMESMGRDQVDAYEAGINDSLGRLAQARASGIFFHQGIAVSNGTFTSLEGILFDTPFSPLTQSQYGLKPFAFSKILDFKRAGYRTVFLTSCEETWRNINLRFPIQGFDEIIGAKALLKRYPQAEEGPWGIADEWLFKYAERLLEQAEQKHEKLFVLTLSSTNHPPHKVPDGYAPGPVDSSRLPADIDRDNKEDLNVMIQTHQYAADQLGGFIEALDKTGLREKVVVAATGDHNTRFKYEGDDNLHRRNGVPVFFWLPPSLHVDAAFARTSWASHRDIFPTVKSLVLGKTPAPYEGRDLFNPSERDAIPATSFVGIGRYGFSISRHGAVGLGEDGELTCYRWTSPERMDALASAACSGELLREGNLARAQRAADDYAIRSALPKIAL